MLGLQACVLHHIQFMRWDIEPRAHLFLSSRSGMVGVEPLPSWGNIMVKLMLREKGCPHQTE